jgi:hypothetical protein
MNPQAQTPKEILRSIHLIYWVFFLTLVGFIFVISRFIDHGQDAPLAHNPEAMLVMKSVFLVIALALIPLSYVLAHKQIAAINRQLSLTEKLSRYRLAVLTRYSLLDMAGILPGIGFLFTADMHLVMVQAIVLLSFLLFRATPFKIANDLELSQEERALLEKE